MKTILRIRIILSHSEPPIWREVEVPADLPLGKLHGVIQQAMGWSDEHIYMFNRGRARYVAHPQAPWPGREKDREAWDYTVQEVYGSRGRLLRYTYDMGDNWEHELWNEGAFAAKPGVAYPRLVGGARACPPEDFGGIFSYRVFLDEGPENFGPWGEWLEDFDPEAFDPSPRALREARVYVDEGEAPAIELKTFDEGARQMLGELAVKVDELLEGVESPFREELRHALEDYILADDATSPRADEALIRALDELPEMESFLLALVEHFDALRARDSAAPLFVTGLLGKRESRRALELFKAILVAASDKEMEKVNAILQALRFMGEKGGRAIQDVLDELEPLNRLQALSILVKLRVEDPRILPYLARDIEERTPRAEAAAEVLSEVKDPRVVEVLDRALTDQLEYFAANEASLDRDKRKTEGEFALFLCNRLFDAGGEVGDERNDALDRIERILITAAPRRKSLPSLLGSFPVEEPFKAKEKPGRNDPCWCESGKKYKKCHMREDEMKS
ncbi:MAG: IS1096 element passenger TnpR family protein [Bradymonadaceae bacterium]